MVLWARDMSELKEVTVFHYEYTLNLRTQLDESSTSGRSSSDKNAKKFLPSPQPSRGMKGW
jgi:hypothetical protein